MGQLLVHAEHSLESRGRNRPRKGRGRSQGAESTLGNGGQRETRNLRPEQLCLLSRSTQQRGLGFQHPPLAFFAVLLPWLLGACHVFKKTTT